MPTVATDRNLLFGILALQMDFINRDQLVAAMLAWSLDKDKPLGRILVDQRALGAKHYALLDPMVAAHIERHGGDPAQSLAALSSTNSTIAHLGRMTDPDIQASLAHVAVARTAADDDPFRTQTFAAGHRFVILRNHAQGGLGIVYVSRDSELNREVALKEIQDRHADNLTSRARFITEAEITGGLEHPGIVPVYGLGQYADGRPFYAMRFIRGDSLKDAITQFHRGGSPSTQPFPTSGEGADGERPVRFPPPVGGRIKVGGKSTSLAEKNLELRKLLRRFQDVCNAIEYAHSRGVLHRDLKPGNIMLGKFGETLVVDWGLAKALGKSDHDEASEEIPMVPSSASGSAETLPGSAIGTPQFMSPEQAAGRLDLLGPASDIYSLGATLYVLLTGKAPFHEDDVGAILHKVQKGEFAAPRQLNSSVPAALDAICRQAMALKPDARYATARALADDIEHWLADEPVTAYREPLPARMRRWMRRHRTVVIGASTTVLVAVIGLIGMLVVQARANQDLKVANAQEQRARNQAQARFELAMQAIKSYYTGASEDVLLREPQLERLRKKLLGSAMGFYNQMQILLADDPAPNARSELAEAYDRAAEITAKIDTVAAALPGPERALAIRDQLAAARPQDAAAQAELADSLIHLGTMLWDVGRSDEAIRDLERACAIRLALTQQTPPLAGARANLAGALGRLGQVLGESARREQALATLQESLAIHDALVRERPNDAGYQRDLAAGNSHLGELYNSMGRAEDSLRMHQLALAIRERITQPSGGAPLASDDHQSLDDRRDLCNTYTAIGNLLNDLSRSPEALAMQTRALEIRVALCREHPTITRLRSERARSLFNLGLCASALGKMDLAIDWFRQSLEQRTELVREQPEVIDFQLELAKCQDAIGVWTYSNGRLDDASRAFRAALAILQPLGRDNPSDIELLSEVSRCEANYAEVLQSLGRSAESIQLRRDALVIRERLARAQPDSPALQDEYAFVSSGLARSLADAGSYDEAIRELKRCIAVYETLTRDHPDVKLYHGDLARACNNMGSVLQQTGQSAEALASFERALAVRMAHPRGDALEQYSLACTLARCSSLAARSMATARWPRCARAPGWASATSST